MSKQLIFTPTSNQNKPRNQQRRKQNYTPRVTMTDQQAITLWNTLDPQQQFQFKEMFKNLNEGKLMLKEVNVDDNEQIQNIVLEPKDKASKPTAPFAKHFKQE